MNIVDKFLASSTLLLILSILSIHISDAMFGDKVSDFTELLQALCSVVGVVGIVVCLFLEIWI